MLLLRWRKSPCLRNPAFIFVCPRDAPVAITQNVAWMKRQFSACQTPRSMYPSIFNSFPVIRTASANKKLSYRWQTARYRWQTSRCSFVKLLRHCRTFCQTRKVWLSDGEKNSKICLFVLTWSTNVTDERIDRQTEEQTDTAWQHRPRLHSVAR